MGITSFYFLCFFTVLLVVYYCIPRKFQWGFLLMGSVAYCLLAGQGALLLYPLVSVGACYAGARMLSGTPAEEYLVRLKLICPFLLHKFLNVLIFYHFFLA